MTDRLPEAPGDAKYSPVLWIAICLNANGRFAIPRGSNAELIVRKTGKY